MANKSQKTVSQNSDVERQESISLISREALVARLRRSRETRTRFVESHLSKGLAYQLRSLRDREALSQQELGERVGMNQNAISRLENPSYGKPTITTLKRLANFYDVGLVVRFVPFSQLINWVTGTPFIDVGLAPETVDVPSFSQELSSAEFSFSASQAQPEPRIGQLSLGLLPPNVIEIDSRIRGKIPPGRPQSLQAPFIPRMGTRAQHYLERGAS